VRALASKGIALILWMMSLALISACHHIPDATTRQQTLIDLIQEHDWTTQLITTPSVDLLAAMPLTSSSHSQLVIYLEGDGLAWVDHTHISNNPTPINPIGLQLALQHPTDNATYLARPCQYVIPLKTPPCSSQLWTNARFSEEIVKAINSAVTQFKQQAQAQSLVLIGYSGGATLALLVAARRNDVAQIITVAGNLDHQAWTQLHQISPLTDSLNPSDYRAALNKIPQVHFVGERDKNIPPQLAETFLNRFADRNHKELRIIHRFNHQCCWVNAWPQLYENISPNKAYQWHKK